MTITIDYEAEKKLEISWEKIIRDIIEEAVPMRRRSMSF